MIMEKRKKLNKNMKTDKKIIIDSNIRVFT